MGIKAILSRKSSTSEHNHMVEAMVRKANENGGLRVISCREEGVVRMKIMVKKSELKQLVEVINSVKDERDRATSSRVEERLNNMLWKKQQSRPKMLKRNHQKCWSPALQCIPEELSF